MTCSCIAASADPHLIPLDIHLIQRGPQATRHLERVAFAPEMHEQESWRLIQHVTVQRRDGDAVGAERAQDGIYFAGDQHEVTRGNCGGGTDRLEVYRGRHAHRRRDLYTVQHHRPGSGDADLIDAAVGLAAHAEDLCNLHRIEAERWRCT